jgi:hypothetical protein
MKKLVLFAAAVLFSVSPALAEEKTWNGVLSDARCNGKHAKAEHGSQADSDHSCVTKCVEGGGKYVFVAGDKTYQISNQDFADLKAHGGHTIALTGEMTGESIKVSKIAMPPAKGK